MSIPDRPPGLPASYTAEEWGVRLDEAIALEMARREARRHVDAEENHVDDLDSLYVDRSGLDTLPQPDPLIPGVLPRHAYGVLRGRDQSFKSFVALDWALTLATGSWWGLTPTARVPVLYIAGEGAWGLRARVAAWEARHRRVEPDWFTVRQSALNLHRPGPAFEHLLEHVSAHSYGLVVVDTLRRVSGAADGNSSEMGAVVDNLDQIKQATADGSVLVVAHTDKADTDSRGYSGIEDDADFVWHARRDGMHLELELTKMKDGPDGFTHHFQAWPEGEGDHASLVLAPTVPDGTGKASTESEDKLLATLREVFPDGAYSGALQDTAGLPKATFHRARAALEARGEMLADRSHGRAFYRARGLAGLTESHAVKPPLTRESLTGLNEVSEVSQVSRPLGSETPETNPRDTPLTEALRNDSRATALLDDRGPLCPNCKVYPDLAGHAVGCPHHQQGGAS